MQSQEKTMWQELKRDYRMADSLITISKLTALIAGATLGILLSILVCIITGENI